MRDIFTLFLHAIVIVIRLGRPGGFRSVVAESVLMRHQVLILNRGRKRAPNLRASDRIIAGLRFLSSCSSSSLIAGLLVQPEEMTLHATQDHPFQAVQVVEAIACRFLHRR